MDDLFERKYRKVGQEKHIRIFSLLGSLLQYPAARKVVKISGVSRSIGSYHMFELLIKSVNMVQRIPLQQSHASQSHFFSVSFLNFSVYLFYF